MEPKHNTYPVFEANQVLSNTHLNEVFDYLDEQQRLSRADLIGIGIVCGLDVRLESNGTTSTIHLSRGCGVSSEGYLIVEPQDVALVAYREYILPTDLDYPPLRDASTPEKPQFPLWELFPAGEPETTPLDTPTNFLSDKAVLLFCELKKAGLRTCSANDCDDRGSEVTLTVRRLLIKQADLNTIISAANSLPPDSTTADLENALLAQLNLPDLRLPRYDVTNTQPVTTNDVYAAFFSVFISAKLAQATGDALSAAYQAFKPILQKNYPADPFTNFSNNFGFLDVAPDDTGQVLFAQYYYDLFDDLLQCYCELRRSGLELLCACCPQAGLFPRHLMLGLLASDSDDKPSIYRQRFLASPAIVDTACSKEVRQIFQRLVEMTARFSNAPPLPAPSKGSELDTQIRLTPSILGNVSLSDKSIPYYYLQDGAPPLFQLWNYTKSRQNKANHNLSYRSDEYTPAAPDFVTNALGYDLEPYNFLRVEGHLGKDFKSVVKSLLTYKTTHRLPIEIIALRTGAFDMTMPVDSSLEGCLFQDLTALYDTLREAFLAGLCAGVIYFYDIPIAGSELAGGKPQHPLVKAYAPDYHYTAGTMGAWFEKHFKVLSVPYIDIDQNNLGTAELLKIAKLLLIGTTGLDGDYLPFLVLIFYLTHLADALPDSLDTLDTAEFENKGEDVIALVHFVRDTVATKLSSVLSEFIPQEDLIDHLDQLLSACRLEPFKATSEQYEARLNEVRKKQFLSFFLENNPGIQHKAGVPMGGTFLVVYHGKSKPSVAPPSNFDVVIGKKEFAAKEAPGRTKRALSSVGDAIKRLGAQPGLKDNIDFHLLIDAAFGNIGGVNKPPPVKANQTDELIQKTVDALDDGTVIADFFLPYLCCSDCPPIQYVLPTPPLGLTVSLGCTDATGVAEATLKPQDGADPFFYQLDQQPPQELAGTIALSEGPHTITVWDSAGAESEVYSLSVPKALTIGTETYADDLEAQTYTVSFTVSGGTAPYGADSGTIAGSTFTSDPVKSGSSIAVQISDSAGCKISKAFQHTVEQTCNLPCDGLSRNCAYRLWLQPPAVDGFYKGYKQESEIRFQFNGETIALPGSNAFLQLSAQQLNSDFQKAIAGAIEALNTAIAKALIAKYGDALGRNRLVLSYKPAGSDPFGILWIEYFVCETFSIEFDFSFSDPATTFSLTMRYTKDGASLLNRRLNNKATTVPAFDCSERNQCLNGDYQKVCKDPAFKAIVNIERLSDTTFTLFGNVSNADPANIAAWIWDVPIALPSEPFYQGNTVSVQLNKPAGAARLTAITKAGCFSVGQQKFP